MLQDWEHGPRRRGRFGGTPARNLARGRDSPREKKARGDSLAVGRTAWLWEGGDGGPERTRRSSELGEDMAALMEKVDAGVSRLLIFTSGVCVEL